MPLAAEFPVSHGRQGTVIQYENARHLFASGHTIIRMVRHGRAIVGQNDAIVLGGPSEYFPIISSGKAHILHSNDVKRRLAQ